MRILLGGVPLGCDNIGDEAILECAVSIVRDVCPASTLTVCTDDPEATAVKLGVRTCPCYGFAGVPASGIARIIDQFDVFFWCGATGLSDYPDAAISLLRIAQEHGVKTIVWGVGMNSELNPVFFSLQRGRRKAALTVARVCTLGLWNAIAWEEMRRETRARQQIAEGLNRADLVVLRDPESREEVLRCGVTREVHVGADSALLLEPSVRESLVLSETVKNLLASPKKKVCVCVSAQREIVAQSEFVKYLDNVIQELDAVVLFLPMNPITDAKLMKELASRMTHRSQVALIEGLHEPGEVLAVLPEMDVVISSRLHLLILASIVHVPIVGISRGSKVDNFLKPYGLMAVGSVEECCFSTLLEETGRLLKNREEFTERSRTVRAELLERLEAAKEMLGVLLCTEKMPVPM